MPTFSANLTFLFNEVPFLERFQAAARAGFSSVEFMFPYDHDKAKLVETAQSAAVQIDLFNLPAGDFLGGERGVATLPDRREEFRSGVDQGLDYADALGVAKLNCLVGQRDDGVAWDAQYACLIENLRWAASRIHAAGRTLHVEQLSPIEVPGFFLDSIDLAERVIGDVGSACLLIQFDIYHVQRSQGDIVATLGRLIDRIGHVQIADSPGRGQPGTGELNYPYILEELDRLGYDGCVGLEYRPTGTTEESFAWLREGAVHVG